MCVYVKQRERERDVLGGKGVAGEADIRRLLRS